MAQCTKWSDCVGLADPLSIVQYCVSLLARDVYPNMVWTKFDFECSRAKPKEPCEGIKLYLEDLCEDREINQEVQYYIKHPCKDEMKRVINKSSKKALQFMLEYLKYRGAFIRWAVDSSVTALNSISKARYIIKYASCYMEALPEIDFCACVCLGRYLHHLLSVAVAHDMFFMQDIIAQIYGPIYIELEVAPDARSILPHAKCVDYAILIFKKMLESCPWYQFSPTESVNRSLYPSLKREFCHKYVELADYIQEKTTMPDELRGINLGEIMYQSRIDNPQSQSLRSDKLRNDQHCPRPLVGSTNRKIPPDTCNINYSEFAGNPHNVPV